MPGFFEWEDEEGGKKVKRRNARVSRIYVSGRDTCWNGRKSEFLSIFCFFFLFRHFDISMPISSFVSLFRFSCCVV